MAFSTSPVAFCTIWSLQGWYGDRSLLAVFLGDIDPAQRFGSVLALFEPLMKLLDVPRGILFILPLSLQWVPWPLLSTPCGSPPSPALQGRKTAPPSVDRRLRS